jgi:hypothetical protein
LPQIGVAVTQLFIRSVMEDTAIVRLIYLVAPLPVCDMTALH